VPPLTWQPTIGIIAALPETGDSPLVLPFAPPDPPPRSSLS
jgi:hypothetical protein